jgi:hypothetical protein
VSVSRVMQRDPQHRTAIAIVRDHVEAWRREHRWSRESVADLIVQTHEHAGYDRLTGIVFDPPTRDTYERQRVNADRIYRWLDDATKDKNLLPANFLWSILAALPDERRLALSCALFAPVGMGACQIDDGADEHPDGGAVLHFQAVVTASSESEIALSRMLDGVDPGEPENAQAKLGRVAAVTRRALRFVGRLIRHQSPREQRHEIR